MNSTYGPRGQSACAHLRGHLRIHLEQLFQPLGVVAEAAADIDAFQHLVIALMRGAEVGGHFFGIAEVGDGGGKHCGDRVREALEAVDDGQQDILGAAIAQLVHDAQPELGTLVLLEPQAEPFLGTIGANAERNVDRLVADDALIADLDPDRIEKHQRHSPVP